MPIAMTPTGEITLLQMDGHLTPDEFHQAMELAVKGCRDIYEIQRKCLIEKYNKLGELGAEPVVVQEAEVL
jgi:exosome complex component RRP41